MRAKPWVTLAALSLLSPLASRGDWLDQGWRSRNRLIVTNPNLVALSDYQKRIELPFLDGMRRKFQDLRFTEADGKTEIGYWLEEVVPEEKAVVWVKIPQLPPTGEATLYVYYGNRQADSRSSFDAVFQKLLPIPGTVGLWHFDEGQGEQVEDFSGRGHRGRLVGNLLFWEEHDGGQWGDRPEICFGHGSCLRFHGDGTSASTYVQVEHAPDLNLRSFTVECWVRLAGTAPRGYNDVVVKGSNVWLLINSTPRPASWFVGGPENTLVPQEPRPILQLNEWYHLASSFDEATGLYRIYVNGVCEAEAKTERPPEPNDAALVMGGCYRATLTGWLDEVRIVARALSAAELRADFERRQFAPTDPQVRLSEQVETAPPG